MERQIQEVLDICEEHRVPLLIAGDLFDRWNSPPELINFAIRQFESCSMPKYAVPGQHDLPYHKYDLLHRSAYGVLVEAGTIQNLRPGKPMGGESGLVVTGFPWGFPVKPPSVKPPEGCVNVALIHAFIWNGKETGFIGATDDTKLSAYRERLLGYDLALFGDNHKPFVEADTDRASCTVVNHGSFFRRTIAEVDMLPRVALIYSDGTVEPHAIDVSKDKFADVPPATSENIDMTALARRLERLGSGQLDFAKVLRRLSTDKRVADDVREVINEVIAEVFG